MHPYTFTFSVIAIGPKPPLYIMRMSILKQAILLQQGPEVQQPATIQLALQPRLLPGQFHLREDVFIGLVSVKRTIHHLPLRGSLSLTKQEQVKEDDKTKHVLVLNP